MPAIHCKHCRHVSHSIGQHGKHMGKAHRAILVAQLRRGARKRGRSFARRGGRAKIHMGHKGEVHFRGDQRRKLIALLVSLLAMLKGLGAIREPRKLKHKVGHSSKR